MTAHRTLRHVVVEEYSKEPLEMRSIVSFNRAKCMYIFYLVAMHQQLLSAKSQSVDLMTYPTVHCGTEFMMGLLLISGWLASSTWKGYSWKDYMKRKALSLMPAYMIAVIITLVPVLLGNKRQSAIIEYILEIFTLGAWNPTLIWNTSNRPLWFMSVLLLFHYAAPFFLPLIRDAGAKSLLALFIALYMARLATSLLTLLALQNNFTELDGHRRMIHMWMPTQMLLPFMGSVLQQLVARLDIPGWMRCTHVRFLADGSLLGLAVISIFTPTTGNDLVDGLIMYANLLNGPLITASVVLMSVDCNSLVGITSAWPELARLFDSMLSLSYVLFLTHWPFALMLRKTRLFSTDSMTTLVGTYCSSVVFAILMKAIVVDPLARLVGAWLRADGAQTESMLPLREDVPPPPEVVVLKPESEGASNYGSVASKTFHCTGVQP